MKDWLDSCPHPVIGRLIDNPMDLQHIIYSRHVYVQNLLLVTDLDSLTELDQRRDKSDWKVYTLKIQLPTGYELVQTKELDEASAIRSAKMLYPNASSITIVNCQYTFWWNKKIPIDKLINAGLLENE